MYFTSSKSSRSKVTEQEKSKLKKPPKGDKIEELRVLIPSSPLGFFTSPCIWEGVPKNTIITSKYPFNKVVNVHNNKVVNVHKNL